MCYGFVCVNMNGPFRTTMTLPVLLGELLSGRTLKAAEFIDSEAFLHKIPVMYAD